jgi:ribose transport system ATP-binding protein
VSARLSRRGITKSFGPTAALRGLDPGLDAGEVHALVGESGGPNVAREKQEG